MLITKKIKEYFKGQLNLFQDVEYIKFPLKEEIYRIEELEILTPQEKYNLFVDEVTNLAIKIRNLDITETECGSLIYLLYGPIKSKQSINVKFGNKLEDLLNEFSKLCGLNIPYKRKHMIGNHQIDTLIIEEQFIEYREQKGNTNLDTEKIEVTIEKIINVLNELEIMYPNKLIKCFVHHTSVWEEMDAAPIYKSKYKEFRKGGVEILFMKDYFEQLGVDITKEEYYNLFIDIGQIIEGEKEITNARRK
jgi:hypothetical protein